MLIVPREQRPFDIIGDGATGFTGRLVVEYLAINGPKNLKYAMAGRSKTKLEEVRQRIAEIEPTAAGIPILVADASDIKSLEAVVSQTKCVITTVGPFIKHGVPLVDACVRLGTDYVDSTGESPFIRKIIDLYHDAAVENGVSIVPSCGFDSIPSDIGALLLTDHFAKKGLKTKAVRYTAHKFKGGISGGTLHSGMGLMELPFKEQLALRSIDYLSPKDTTGPKSSSSALLRYEKATKKWQNYFFMEVINTRNVRRSWALLSKAYGSKFEYSETMASPNFVVALFIAIGMTLVMPMVFLPPVRWLLKKLVPQGTGPSEEMMKNGFFTVKLVGEAEDGPDRNIFIIPETQSKAIATFHGNADPGYRGTALMLAESALCFVLQKGDLIAGDSKVVGSFPPLKGGVLTTATAFGLVLAERLRKAGFTLSVDDL
ncbi:saccharopine dehydrogenase [Chytridium lagenaria]|nr:saccharopine dehydrogenase [Chytridium lagenaria]